MNFRYCISVPIGLSGLLIIILLGALFIMLKKRTFRMGTVLPTNCMCALYAQYWVTPIIQISH